LEAWKQEPKPDIDSAETQMILSRQLQQLQQADPRARTIN
jgi:hypothetical protein